MKKEKGPGQAHCRPFPDARGNDRPPQKPETVSAALPQAHHEPKIGDRLGVVFRTLRDDRDNRTCDGFVCHPGLRLFWRRHTEQFVTQHQAHRHYSFYAKALCLLRDSIPLDPLRARQLVNVAQP